MSATYLLLPTQKCTENHDGLELSVERTQWSIFSKVLHKFRKDLLSIYWNLLEKEDGEKCERRERIATKINVKYTCSNHWKAGLGGRALRNVKFQWTALKMCSCCANSLSCKVTFRYRYENLIFHERWNIKLRARSTNNYTPNRKNKIQRLSPVQISWNYSLKSIFLDGVWERDPVYSIILYFDETILCV